MVVENPERLSFFVYESGQKALNSYNLRAEPDYWKRSTFTVLTNNIYIIIQLFASKQTHLLL